MNSMNLFVVVDIRCFWTFGFLPFHVACATMNFKVYYGNSLQFSKYTFFRGLDFWKTVQEVTTMDINFSLMYIAILSLPLFLNILLPLLMLSGWLLFQPLGLLYSRMVISETSKTVREHDALDVADKRDDKRISVAGLVAEVADGSGVYNGLVTNISRAGICLVHLPERLSSPVTKLSVIIRNKTDEYCFFLQPAWNEMHNPMGRCIGGRLENVPSKWREFVQSC